VSIQESISASEKHFPKSGALKAVEEMNELPCQLVERGIPLDQLGIQML
jgi:hypothetical protein